MKKPSIQERRYLNISRNHYAFKEYNYTIFFKALHLKVIKGMCFDGTEIAILGMAKNDNKDNFYFIFVRNIDEHFIPLQNEIELLKEFFIIHYGL